MGGLFVWLCVPNFGTFGSFVIDIVVMIISLVLITERSAILGMKKGSQKVYQSAREDAMRYHDNQQRRREERELRRIDKKVEGVAIDTSVKKPKKKGRDEISEIKTENILDLPEISEEEHIAVTPLSSETISVSPKQADNALPEIFLERAMEESGNAPVIEPEPAISESAPEYEDAAMLEG